MQERLTLLRPPDAGRALALAIHDIEQAPIAIDAASIGRIAARLACGSFDDVRRLLHDPPPSPALPLIVARYLRWSGDLHTAVSAWPAVERGIDEPGAGAELRRATLDELQPAAIDIGSPALAARLRALAREMTAAATLVETDPAVLRVFDVAFHLLGLEPDAVRGRLRLRPLADVHPQLEARHVRCGDSSIEIVAQRTDREVVIRIEQTTGSIPLTALLEPVVQTAVAAEVDGVAADLAIRTSDDGVVVPVQLVLDDVRTLCIRRSD